jgi:hypothetical protein
MQSTLAMLVREADVVFAEVGRHHTRRCLERIERCVTAAMELMKALHDRQEALEHSGRRALAKPRLPFTIDEARRQVGEAGWHA